MHVVDDLGVALIRHDVEVGLVECCACGGSIFGKSALALGIVSQSADDTRTSAQGAGYFGQDGAEGGC